VNGGKRYLWKRKPQESQIEACAIKGHNDRVLTQMRGKFLKIFAKVSGIIPLNLDAEIRIEYGDENFFPSTYHIQSVAHDQGVTRVLLEPTRTTCKAHDRRRECRNANAAAESCCALSKRGAPVARNVSGERTRPRVLAIAPSRTANF